VPKLGVYVHVPWCAARCGYCDFNTYVPRAGEDRGWFGAAVRTELVLARERVGGRPVSTVFIGGGTPTLLEAEALTGIITAIREELGLAPGAEVTVEANPESVDRAKLEALRAGGINRISLGMQSAAPHVLRALDRVHTPGRPVEAAREARAAGFDHVSLDLIYGTPGERDDDWRRSVESALEAGPDHVSAYALTVETGTRLHAQVRRGELPMPDDDAMAARYEIADDLLTGAGLHWYEVSNWARDDDARCRHNLGYWRGDDWWGAGPGAHSHVDGHRWWNVLRPHDWRAALARSAVPVAGEEHLDDATRRFERIMLEVRLAEGLDRTILDADGEAAAATLLAEGLLTDGDGRLRLTRAGRLRADLVVRALTG
jgi:putative oxygen-independent coproporphyrinogen III oxidase